MYTQDKTKRITLRLNEEQFDFIRMNAEMLDVSPSDFLRMVINASLSAAKAAMHNEKVKAGLEEVITDAKEGLGRENDEANQHNIV